MIIAACLENGCAPRDDRWCEALAVSSLAFVEKVKGELGIKAVVTGGSGDAAGNKGTLLTNWTKYFEANEAQTSVSLDKSF